MTGPKSLKTYIIREMSQVWKISSVATHIQTQIQQSFMTWNKITDSLICYGLNQKEGQKQYAEVESWLGCFSSLGSA